MNQESLATLIRKGKKLQREGKQEAAIETYKRCIELNPNSAWSHYYLGEVWLELNNWHEASTEFSKAVELNPYSGWSYHRLGEALFKLGNFNQAETNLSKACELNPDNSQFYKALGWLYRKNKRWNDSINCYSKVIQLNPKDFEAYYFLASAWKIKGDVNQAIAICKQGLEKHPQEPQLTSQFEDLIGEKKAKNQKEKIIICAIFKDEAAYILEWIAYHQAIKVDHFIIYDNGSTDGTTEILQGLAKAGIITHIKWPDISKKGGAQVAAYEDAVARWRDKCEWIGFIDADEFILLNQHNDIKSFLDDYQDVDGIAINWKLFGSSGHNSVTDGLVIERFTKSTKSAASVNSHFKTIAKIDSIKPTDGVRVHVCRFKSNNPIYVYADLAPVTPESKGMGSHIDHKIVQINHYFTKSKHEWNLKIARGKADRAPGAADEKRLMSEFYQHNQEGNVKEDLKIKPWLENTKKQLKILRSFVELEDLKAQVRFAKAILRESQKELQVCQAALSQCQEDFKKT
ncbi:MAG: tetratricopeptide repeat protein [Okeania sp. SIO3B3]|nr:tetratricopeptide repeat protein [Okeania sp. SIO3B3]